MSGIFKAVSSIFGGGKPEAPPVTLPPPPEPPPAPTIEDADVKAREAEDVLRRRKGRAAAILTGTAGAGTPKTATKVLLGG